MDYRHVDRSLNEAEDIISRFKHNEEALKNTRRIADRINIEIELDDWHFAPAEEIGVPEDTSAEDYLRKEVYTRVFDTYDNVTPEMVGRIEYELAIIELKGYSPYFLCVADYVQYARDRGIVETTRGSAAGSLVSYILDITIVDPVRFQLPFERFLNPYRPSAPDIDTDFADDRRDEVIRYLFDTYGEDRVAQIITFGTMKARGAVRDAGRVLGYSYSFCDQVAKLIPMDSDGIKEAIQDDPELQELYQENEKVERLLDLSKQIEGRARHTSIHAAGVVISPTNLTDFTPVQLETDGDNVTTQYEMHSVESAGVLKYDVLGIRNLSILGNAVDLVEET
ncbi:MAG: DNA polymerase III subunit alpha, partial [Parcubacteria group bacterium QH_9_35_7]